MERLKKSTSPEVVDHKSALILWGHFCLKQCRRWWVGCTGWHSSAPAGESSTGRRTIASESCKTIWNIVWVYLKFSDFPCSPDRVSFHNESRAEAGVVCYNHWWWWQGGRDEWWNDDEKHVTIFTILSHITSVRWSVVWSQCGAEWRLKLCCWSQAHIWYLPVC